MTYELPEISSAFFDSIRFAVVEAADPTNIISPLPLTIYEANALCNELINDTGMDWLVINIETGEVQS